MVSGVCGHHNPPNAKFCRVCGEGLIRCAACGCVLAPTVKFCGECGARVREQAAPSSSTQSATDRDGGERRQLTVLFCDLVGSTELSTQLDPEEWRDVVAVYQRTAAATVARFGGHVAKYLGDGVLACFGYPQAHEDDAERCVRAGLAIVDAVRALTPGTNGLAANHLALHVRVGIHTGLSVIADAGHKADLFGETPNIAARLQALAAPDTVIFSGATLRLVRGIFILEELGAEGLKGVAEALDLYRAVRPSGVRSRLDVAAGRLTPFVGRDVELATLVDRWERAADGQGQNVLVIGEPGVGKSRLAYQLRERLTNVPHTWLECRATPYTEGTPFFPVIELVQQGLAFTPDDTARDKLDKIAAGLTLMNLLSPEAPLLMAAFLGLPHPETYPVLQMSPELQRRKTMDLLAAWNLALGEGQPLVLLVEDLHWCDLSTLELIGRIIEQSATSRVLFIGTARPEFSPPWPPRSNLSLLQLARLTKRQALEIVKAIGGAGLSPEVLQTIVTRGDGVPLYIEELTKAVVDPGAARGVEAIPATLADSLMARLDRLSSAKDVAQHAAVLGREFSYALLAATAGLEDAALQHGLTRLIEAEVLFARGVPPTATYTFKHALVQEAAYGSLLKRTRKELHQAVVRALVTGFPERAAAEPEVVARHAEAAGLTDEAITYYQRAGEQALTKSAHEEAIGQLRKAISLLAGLPQGPERDAREVSLQLVLGTSLGAVRGYAHGETGAAYERALALGERSGQVVQLAWALIGLSAFRTTAGELERAIALAERALALSRETRQPELLATVHQQLGAQRYYQGRFAAALAHSEQTIAWSESVPDRAITLRYSEDVGVSAHAYAAWSLFNLGWPDRARVRVQEAVALARALAHPFSLVMAMFYDTVVHWLRGAVEAQRDAAAQVISLSEVQGFPLWLGVGHAWHGAARAALGAGAEAVDEVRDGLARAAATGSQAGAPALLELLAETHAAAGQPAEALSMVDMGLSVAAQTGQHLFDANLHRLKGELVLAAEHPHIADAEDLFRRALDIARAQEARSFELRTGSSLSRLLRDQGRRGEARALLAPLYAWFTEGFDARDLIEAKTLLDDLGR